MSSLLFWLFQKTKVYAVRYGPNEIAAIVAVVFIGQIIFLKTHDRMLVVASATLTDPLAYYGVGFLRNRKHEKSSFHTIGRMILEHLIPGLINGALVRPILLFWAPQLVGNFLWGTLLGKLFADVFFYMASAPMHEFSLRIFPKKSAEIN